MHHQIGIMDSAGISVRWLVPDRVTDKVHRYSVKTWHHVRTSVFQLPSSRAHLLGHRRASFSNLKDEIDVSGKCVIRCLLLLTNPTAKASLCVPAAADRPPTRLTSEPKRALSSFVNCSIDNTYTDIPKPSTSTFSHRPEPASPLQQKSHKAVSHIEHLPEEPMENLRATHQASRCVTLRMSRIFSQFPASASRNLRLGTLPDRRLRALAALRNQQENCLQSAPNVSSVSSRCGLAHPRRCQTQLRLVLMRRPLALQQPTS